MSKIKLPIDEHLPDLCSLIISEKLVLVAASPGSGKTTRLPPALIRTLTGKVIVLEPRRIAAVTAAHRIAAEENVRLGEEVGYQIRFEDQSTPRTRLLFLTEALLQKKLLDDPGLDGVNVVILDEFHERSIHTETALALLLELQESFRPDLHIVIMSATLQIEALRDALPHAAVFEVVAPPYPLEIRKDHRAQVLRPGHEFYDRMLEKVREGLNNSPGQKDVLVFLPGTREIQNLAERLLEKKINAAVLPLHAQLPVAEQLKALTPTPGIRRVILATNVAESALTLDGVDTVVDSGLERVQQLHHKTGFPSLDLVRISHASATQRAGRAARQGPGLAIQAWSIHDEPSMSAERPPEIHRVDLADLTMTLSGLRVVKPESLLWIDPPHGERWRKARLFLQELELIDQDGRLTTLGEQVNRYPLHPRWGKLLAVALENGVGTLGARVAALLQSWNQEGRLFSDLEQGLSMYESGRNPRFGWTRKTEEQLLRLLPKDRKSVPTSEVVLEKIMFATFPDRLARKRDGQDAAAVMVGNRGLRLPAGSWQNLESFLALELIEGLKDHETQCSLLLRLTPRFVAQVIEPMAEKIRRVEWSSKDERFVAWAGLQYRGLWITEPHREPARADEVSEALVDVAVDRWVEFRARNQGLRDWLLRYRYYRLKKKGDAVEPTAEQIREILGWACQGEKSLGALYDKDISAFLASVLLGEAARDFDKSCPAFLTTPKGKVVPVHYPEQGGTQAPLIEVRIQDAFGWPESPQICGEALVIDLLAPNGRPAQRTQNLKSFWTSSYLDVRKDLRARYPKHPWPENPMNPDDPELQKRRSSGHR